ncbi:hypothetical protein CR513_03218, partial [Mucuna pruriens]
MCPSLFILSTMSDEDMTKSVALEGLGGPMTRARTKRAKEDIQQVFAALIQKELNLEAYKPKLINLLIELEE